MNLLLLIIVLLLLFGGGGFYIGGPAVGGGGLGLIILICLIIYLFGGFRGRKLPGVPGRLRSGASGLDLFDEAGQRRLIFGGRS